MNVILNILGRANIHRQTAFKDVSNETEVYEKGTLLVYKDGQEDVLVLVKRKMIKVLKKLNLLSSFLKGGQACEKVWWRM